MAEGTYEYECMRAELLGLEKPNYEEFERDRLEKEKKEVEEEVVDTENLKDVDNQKESMSRISGGLEELNTILKKTQFKISRFKASYSSIAGLLRRDSKSDSSTSLNATSQQEDGKGTQSVNAAEDCLDGEDKDNKDEPQGRVNDANARKSDLAKALDSDFSKLDSMLEKAENAQYSMEHQRKQMTKFLK